MKIAFFSYEYPPETGGGGIGTYLVQMVLHLPKYGHFPVVFCATAKQDAFWENDYVYRIPASNYKNYNKNLPFYFSTINDKVQFDIAEGTDFRACGIDVMKQFPQLPFTVKAHSANFLVDKFLFQPLSLAEMFHFFLGGLRKFKISKFPSPPKVEDYAEEKYIIRNCDLVLSPSHSIGRIYKELSWCEQYTFFPYIYEPNKDILSIKPNGKYNSALKIIFYGRLEIRKGVLEIAEAIPYLLKKYPTLQFYFFGKSANSPKSGIDMQTFLAEKLKMFGNNVFFRGSFLPQEIISVLELGDIFLFPSRYDSFGLVCCEAMAAGKAVIGSRSGGMAEIIEEDVSGLLVSPNNPKQIIEAVTMLVESREKRVELGINARKRILETYSAKKIIPMQIKAYQQVIDKKNGESTKFS